MKALPQYQAGNARHGFVSPAWENEYCGLSGSNEREYRADPDTDADSNRDFFSSINFRNG